jgi:Divergent InlB B-repeat domain
VTGPFEATLRVNGDGALASAARVFGTRYRAHYQITASTAGNGGGSLLIDGTNLGTSVVFVGPNGSTTTLQAAPSSLSTFAGWSGACTGIGDCVLTPADNADLEVTATFNFTP